MLTFKQFLMREEFYKGGDTHYGYVEIFKNPSKYEMRDLAKENRETGAIISGKNLYVWNRNEAEHGDVKHLIPRTSKNWIPLYLYYTASDNSVTVSVSSYSMYSSGREDYNAEEIFDACKEHPAFKVFSTIKKSRYG